MAIKKNKLIVDLFNDAMRTIRPWLGPDNICLFAPYTCTLFAADQLTHKPFYKAVFAIAWRLLSCNPINGFIRWYGLLRTKP